MGTSLQYLRGEISVDPYRCRNKGTSIVNNNYKKDFAVQCSECGKWRKIQTNNLPKYKFQCFYCNNKGQMKKYNFYQFNFRELPSSTNQDLYIKKLNDTIR